MIFTAVLLAIALINYSMIADREFRTVEFLSVLALGMLTGVFLVQFFHSAKKGKN